MATGRITRYRGRWQPRLDRIYNLPDPFYSLEAYQRLTHADLETMTLDEIDDERLRLRYQLSYEQDPDPWLYDRRQRLDRARERCARR